MRWSGRGTSPARRRVRGFAATEFEHQRRGEVEARQTEGGIDAALEAIPRIAGDPELPTRLRRGGRIPERALDQHVDRGLVAARGLAAHDAGDRLGPAVVGDDEDRRVERVGLAVQRRERLAVTGSPDHDVALDLGGIEDMQRPAVVEGHVVGDVDQRVDGPQPDRGQPALHPGGRRAVADAAHEAEPESRAEVLVPGREIEPHRDRLGESALDGANRDGLQAAEPGRREVARDSVDAGGIGAVRRERHVDHRIVETRIGAVGRADRRIVGELDDAVVVVGELELGCRAEHAVRLDTADDARPEGQVLARDEGPWRREDADEAGSRIGRAAHDLDRACPLPVSTVQTRSRSALGCCTASITRATTKPRRRSAGSSTPSTSRPTRVSVSVISDSDASVSR